MPDEAKEDDEVSLDLPPFVELLIGFLPIDIEALIKFCKSIHSLAQDTSWNSVFRRIATAAITLTSISAILSGAILIFLDSNFKDLEMSYNTLLGALLIFLFVLAFAKWFVKQMQNINQANSPVAEGVENRWGILIELTLGISFITALVYLALEAVAPVDIVFISAIGGTLAGLAIAGVALIFSGLYRIYEVYYLEEETIEYAKTLDDF